MTKLDTAISAAIEIHPKILTENPTENTGTMFCLGSLLYNKISHKNESNHS